MQLPIENVAKIIVFALPNECSHRLQVNTIRLPLGPLRHASERLLRIRPSCSECMSILLFVLTGHEVKVNFIGFRVPATLLPNVILFWLWTTPVFLRPYGHVFMLDDLKYM